MKHEARWMKTPLTEFGDIDEIEFQFQVKTPEGRRISNKRGASPLAGQEKKQRDGSESQTDDEDNK